MLHGGNELYEFTDFRLDVSERLLLRKGKRVALSEKAFAVLCILVRESGHLVGKNQLLAEVWADAVVEENNLDKSISLLRQVLGERKGREKFIETVRGHGYRFVAEVRRVRVDEEPKESRGEKEKWGSGAEEASAVSLSADYSNQPVSASHLLPVSASQK